MFEDSPETPDETSIARVVRAVEADTRRSALRRAKEVREQITREGIKAGIPPRRQQPPPRKPQRQPVKPPPPADRAWSFAGSAPLDIAEYEVVRELNHSGAAIVYAAKRTGSADAAFAIKALTPPVIWSAGEAKQRIKEFVSAAELQQRAAAAHPRGNWAVIHGAPVEIRGQGAYYVTDRFIRTADDLASPQREAVSEEDLWQLVSGIVDGLEQLEKTADRPHGNLKPGNVLLARRKGGYRAMLCDPLADGAAATRAGRARDLHDLGDLIRRLVLRDGGGTDAATASLLGGEGDWARLGKTAGAWRALCGALLEGGSRYPTHADLRKSLFPLRVAHANSKRKTAIAAVAITLAIGGSAWALWPKSYSPADWRALCKQWEWFESARGVMSAYVTRGSDPKLDAALSADVTAMNPKRIASGVVETYAGLEGMADAPPPSVASQAGITQTRKGLALIYVLHTRMKPQSWVFFKDAEAQIKEIAPFEPRLAATLEKTLAAGAEWVEKETPAPPDGLSFLVRFLAGGSKSLSNDLKRLNSTCAQVEAATAGDPFAVGLTARIRADIDNSRLAIEGFGARLASSEQLAQAMLGGLGPNAAARFDWPQIREKVDGTNPFPSGEIGLASAQAVKGWLGTVAPAYAFVEPPRDPRKSMPWAKTLALDSLMSRIAAARQQPGASDEWQKELDVAEQKALTLSQVNHAFVARGFVNRELPELDQEAKDLLASAGDMSKAIAAIEAQVQVDPAKWLPEIAATKRLESIRSSAVNVFWAREKDALLNRYKDPKEFNTLYREVHAKLSLTAHKLDDLLPPSASDKGEEAFAWAKPFRDFEVGYRERALADLTEKLLALPPRGDIPPGFLNDDVPRALHAWEAWQKALAGWIERGIDLHRFLVPAGGLYAMDETPAGEKSTLQDAWRVWLASAKTGELSAAAGDAGVTSALNTVTARYQTLTAALGDSPPPTAVKEMLQAGRPPEDTWAGWRAAAKLVPPDWLALADELAVRDAVLKLAASVPMNDRAATLNKEIRNEGRRRWVMRVKPPAGAEAGTTKPTDKWPAGLTTVEAALPLRDGFEVGPDDTLDPKARFNLRLARLIADARPLNDAKTPEAQVAANDKALSLITKFLADMTADADTRSDASVAKLFERLQQAKTDAEDPRLANRASTVPLTENGRGWAKLPNGAGESDEDALAFTHPALRDPNNKPIVFQFARVDLSDQPSAFVLRNAVTINQFLGVLPATTLKETDVKASSQTAVGTFSALSDAQPHLAVRKFWVVPNAAMAGNNLQPLAPGLTVAPPDGTLPMQALRAERAAKWAQGLGLRLPTVGEWKAAVEVERNAGAAHRWNLRDVSWKKQDDYFQSTLRTAGDPGMDPRQMGRFGRATEDGAIWNAALTGPANGGDAYDDGHLLFLPAEPAAKDLAYGKTFFHVIGNVWQFVTDYDFKKIYVVGGSALSSPALRFDTPIEAKDKFAAYTDVGFRIAFEAPVQRPRTRLLAAVRNAELLHD